MVVVVLCIYLLLQAHHGPPLPQPAGGRLLLLQEEAAPRLARLPRRSRRRRGGAGGGNHGRPRRRKASPEPVGREESLVITPRFRPRGRIALRALGVKTPYGDLEIDASDIVHIAFGAVEADSDDEVGVDGESAAASSESAE